MNKPYTVAARVILEKDDLAFPGERVLVARFRLYGEADVAARALSAYSEAKFYITDTRSGKEFTHVKGLCTEVRHLEEA